MSRNFRRAAYSIRDWSEAREMEALAVQGSSDDGSDRIAGSVRGLRKRKEYSEEATSPQTSNVDTKRRRTIGQPLVSDVSTGVALTMYGKKESGERDYCSGRTQATSTASACCSAPGYASTVTTLNEEGDSKFVESFEQRLEVVSQLNTLTFREGSQTQFVGLAGQYVGRHRGHRYPSSKHRDRKKHRKFWHGDGEVMSPHSDSVVTNSASREEDLKFSSGPGMQSENSDSTRLREFSGCSSVDTGKRENVWRTDYNYSERQLDDSGQPKEGGSSQQHQSSSVITNLSKSRSSALRSSELTINSQKRLRFREPLCISENEATVTETDSPVAVVKANDSLCVADENRSRRFEENPEIHITSRSLQHNPENISKSTGSSSSSDDFIPLCSDKDGLGEQQKNSPPTFVLSSGRSASSSDELGPQCSDKDGSEGQQQCSPPTFVLSSGRLSKDQQMQLGIRPTTIDDDFERYFAQLML